MGNSHLYKQWKSRLTFMLFVTPASLFLMLFWLVPIAAAIGISFTDWDYMTSGFQMTGWANYQGLLKDKAFLGSPFPHPFVCCADGGSGPGLGSYTGPVGVVCRKEHHILPYTLLSLDYAGCGCIHCVDLDI